MALADRADAQVFLVATPTSSLDVLGVHGALGHVASLAQVGLQLAERRLFFAVCAQQLGVGHLLASVHHLLQRDLGDVVTQEALRLHAGLGPRVTQGVLPEDVVRVLGPSVVLVLGLALALAEVGPQFVSGFGGRFPEHDELCLTREALQSHEAHQHAGQGSSLFDLFDRDHVSGS